jgi:hypothetical protein
MADCVKLDVTPGASVSEFHEKVESFGPARMPNEPYFDLSGKG